MKPVRSILDKKFRYAPSYATDLRKTFAKIKRELAKHKEQPHGEK